MRKKILSVMLLGAMCVGFVTCDNNEPEVKPDGTTTETTPPENSDDNGTLPPENPDSTETTTPTDPEPQKHHVELEFWNGTLDGVKGTTNLHMDTINKYLNDKYVDSIYLVLYKGSTFGGCSQSRITTYRNIFQQRTDLSPRIRGRGDFVFSHGRALSDDSLYFVSKGWTVNNHLNKQH